MSKTQNSKRELDCLYLALLNEEAILKEQVIDNSIFIDRIVKEDIKQYIGPFDQLMLYDKEK